jgi:hypothetical protein
LFGSQIPLITALADDMPAYPQRGQRDEPKRKRARGKERQESEEQHDKGDSGHEVASSFE